MAGKKRTALTARLLHLRTHALVAYAMHRAGVFRSKEPKDVTLVELIAAITANLTEKQLTQVLPRNNVSRKERVPNLELPFMDLLSTQRFERWIKCDSGAARGFGNLLEVWDAGPFDGIEAVFRSGPADSLLFQGMEAPIDSTDFFSASGLNFETLCAQTSINSRMSDNVSLHLNEMRTAVQNSPDDIPFALKYLAACVTWFRYVIITLHSAVYVLDELGFALQNMRRISKSIKVIDTGVVSYPINTGILCDWLSEMVLASPRYGRRLESGPQEFNDPDAIKRWAYVSDAIRDMEMWSQVEMSSQVEIEKKPKQRM